MSEHSTALVHVEGLGRSEIHRERRRRRREKRARVGACGAAAAILLSGAAVWAWPERSSGATGEIPVAAPPQPPPPPTAILAQPESVTTTTAPPWERWPVELPGLTVDGWLVTDGQHAPRIVPGHVGQAVVSIPADPTAAATFNLGGRPWRVIERRQFNPADLQGVLQANPIVPTVLLVSNLATNPRPAVVAR